MHYSSDELIAGMGIGRYEQKNAVNLKWRCGCSTNISHLRPIEHKCKTKKQCVTASRIV